MGNSCKISFADTVGRPYFLHDIAKELKLHNETAAIRRDDIELKSERVAVAILKNIFEDNFTYEYNCVIPFVKNGVPVMIQVKLQHLMSQVLGI